MNLTKKLKLGGKVSLKVGSVKVSPPPTGLGKGIRCASCNAKGTVVAIVVFKVRAPLAKGGGIKMAGIPVNHKKVKESWENQTNKVCTCTKCKASLKYVKGAGLTVMEA